MDDTTETPDQFFTRYAVALTEVDLEALADCYAYPALPVSRLGRQAIPDAATTRDFFAANALRYHDRGISAVTIGNLRPAYDQDGLWVGLADLTNSDAAGNATDVERNAYQLVLEAGRWRIAVTTPLDAR